MEALFSPGVTALKLGYMITQNKFWGTEKAPCGSCISSPGYVITTEEDNWIVHCKSLLCHAANRGHGDGRLRFTLIFFLFFQQPQKKKRCLFFPLWDASPGYRAEPPCPWTIASLTLHCHTDHSLWLLQISVFICHSDKHTKKNSSQLSGNKGLCFILKLQKGMWVRAHLMWSVFTASVTLLDHLRCVCLYLFLPDQKADFLHTWFFNWNAWNPIFQ